MSEWNAPDFRRVRNREPLCRLASGMEITRAIKHEAIDFASLTRQELIEKTDDRNGSKFLRDWTLERMVAWLEEQIILAGWQFPPGAKARISVVLDEPVGYVSGKLVKTVTITASGRWVHAYPDED